MREWIETHGTDALQRAYSEGYDVAKGAGDCIVSKLQTFLELEIVESWRTVEERTSPHADAFAKRDLVQACVKTIEAPPGWTVGVSKISRITFTDEDKCTGVMVAVRDENRQMIRHVGINFER